jgi:uncharacterized protein (TIGR03118 family)
MTTRSTGPQGDPAVRRSAGARRLGRAGLVAAGATAALAALPAASGLAATAHRGGGAHQTAYTQTNLVSDIPGVARITDPNLVNPWGMAEVPHGPLWVSNTGTNTATIYTGALRGGPLTPASLVVKTPAATPPTPTGATGQVFNGTKGFIVSDGTHSGPATFIFATISGDIDAWNPAVGTASGTSTNAVAVVKAPATSTFTGLAILGQTLYAANARSPRLEVFDSKFQPVTLAAGAFTDPRLPAGLETFNVAAIGGRIYVSYAAGEDNTPGAGVVDVYSPSGMLLKRLISAGPLNEPWAMVTAPSHFGSFSGDLLVGNFGNGGINAFNPRTGAFLGALKNADGHPILIDRLWDLSPGNGVAGTPHELFFSAGIGDEEHGLLGTIAG